MDEQEKGNKTNVAFRGALSLPTTIIITVGIERGIKGFSRGVSCNHNGTLTASWLLANVMMLNSTVLENKKKLF